MSTGKTYDIKVGYSCNNDCFHCVIKPNTYDHHGNFNLSYKEILDCINSPEAIDASNITITGGEPTIRRDFMRIMKYINDRYPEKNIALQTNGRELKQYVQELYDSKINIYFVIAIHGIKDIHNKVTGKKGDSFEQTLSTIKEINRVYGDFDKVGRIEIVLSSLNYREIVDTVKFLYGEGIKNIGISYPHFDGYYIHDPEEARIRSFSYGELKPKLFELYKLCKEHEDLYLTFEKVPNCMWRDDKEMLLQLPQNIVSMDRNIEDRVAVKYPGKETDNNFMDAYMEMHRQAEVCSKCIKCCECPGVWFEAIELFGEDDFIPIKNDEEAGKCTY